MKITTPGFYRLTKPIEFMENNKTRVYPIGSVVEVTEVNTAHNMVNIPMLRGWMQDVLECTQVKVKA